MSRLLQGARNRLLRLRLAVKRRFKRRQPMYVVGLSAPRWLERLLKDDIRLIEGRPSDPEPDFILIAANDQQDEGLDRTPAGWAGIPVVGYRATSSLVIDPAAFVQPSVSSPLTAGDLSGLPDEFKSLAQGAERVMPDLPNGGSDATLSMWAQKSGTVHRHYREAFSRTSRDLLLDAASVAGLKPRRPDDSVTVVCVTNRPAQLGRIVDNYRRQNHDNRRLLIVANSSEFDPIILDQHVDSVSDASWIQIPEDDSLGYCLNQALERCSTRYLAKFDDDDHYGAHYLSDALLCHEFTNAAVIGKHTYFVYLESRNITALRFPGKEFTYTSFVAGGTLLIDMPQVEGLRFEDRSVGEDTAFLLACQRAGKDVFAADRYNYLQMRGVGNTWPAPEDAFLSSAVELATGPVRDLVDA